MLAFKQKARHWTSVFPITVFYGIFSRKLPQTEYLEFKVTVQERSPSHPFAVKGHAFTRQEWFLLLKNVLNCLLVFAGHYFVTLYWA